MDLERAAEEDAESWSSAFDYGDRLAAAWAAVQKWLPVLFIGAFLRTCSQGAGGGIGNLPDLGNAQSELGEAGAIVIVVVAVVVVIVALALFLFSCWITPGWRRALLRSATGEEPRFSDLFSGADRFLAQLGVMIVGALIQFGTLLPTAVAAGVVWYLTTAGGLPEMAWLGVALLALVNLIGLVYVNLGLLFADIVVTVEGLGPLDAVARSWELAHGHRVTLFVFVFLSGIVGILLTLAGYCLLCVGVFFTAPLAVALNEHALMDAYARVVGLRAVAATRDTLAAGPPQSADSPWDAPPT